MIDTHCHLFFDELFNNIDKVIDEARESGIKYIICPSTNLETAEKTLNICEKFDIVYGAVGIHPHDTAGCSDSDIKTLEELMRHKKVVAIGEIGLDYYYDYSPKEKQQEAFKAQLELASDKNLPVIIHSRESSMDIMNIYSELKGKRPVAQFHCFDGGIEYARQIIKLGSYVSFTGNITYPKREDLREVIRQIDVEDILLETDAPFMSPIPFRGKTNTPAYLVHTVKKLAELFNLTCEDIIRTTDANVLKIYGIGEKGDIAFTYKIGNSLYINVTNRCNADCVFCHRNGFATIRGYNLRIPKNMEPPAEVYIKEIGDPTHYKEIVFCGYGEPTIRIDIVKEVAKYVKSLGGRTRINTNGHGNYINKRNILPELKGLIDCISVSLNSTDRKQYSKLMNVSESMFDEMLTFAQEAKNYIPEVVFSVVGLDAVDIKSAEKLAVSIGIKLRVRTYF